MLLSPRYACWLQYKSGHSLNRSFRIRWVVLKFTHRLESCCIRQRFPHVTSCPCISTSMDAVWSGQSCSVSLVCYWGSFGLSLSLQQIRYDGINSFQRELFYKGRSYLHPRKGDIHSTWRREWCRLTRCRLLNLRIFHLGSFLELRSKVIRKVFWAITFFYRCCWVQSQRFSKSYCNWGEYFMVWGLDERSRFYGCTQSHR